MAFDLGGVARQPFDWFNDTYFPSAGKAARGPLDKIPGTLKPYYDPYINAGTSSLPGFQEFMNQLMKDPGSFVNMLGKGYQQSPGYKWNLEQGENAINNAQAAGGMLGTPQHEQFAGELANNLASKDYGDYVDRLLRTMGLGAQGVGGLISGGQQAGSELARALAETLMNKSNLNFREQEGRNSRTGSLFGMLGGLFGG